jgi:hypothetical protein
MFFMVRFPFVRRSAGYSAPIAATIVTGLRSQASEQIASSEGTSMMPIEFQVNMA